MPSDEDGRAPPRSILSNDVAGDLVRLMPRDLVFVMRFMGESQFRLQGHFQDFIRAELCARGVTTETHPMIHLFIENHAILLHQCKQRPQIAEHHASFERMQRTALQARAARPPRRQDPRCSLHRSLRSELRGRCARR